MQQSFIRPDEMWHTLGLRAGQTVAHLGCGAGYYLIPAAKIVGTNGSVIGVDIRADILSEAMNRATRESVEKIVRTVRGNLEGERGSTLEDGSIDWVLVANVLHQSDPLKILTEAARIVKANGSVIVIDWDVAATPFGPPNEHRLSETEAQHLINQVKLTLKHRFSPSPYHYGLVVGHA
jgi:ubiquinone/menaquinone biosynthesis C-methylase UbiE